MRGPCAEQAMEANDVINFLRARTAITGLIRAECRKENRKGVSIIRPVDTCWTSHFQAYKRLFSLKTILQLIILDDGRKPERSQIIIQGTTHAKEKAHKVVETLQRSSFWVGVGRCVMCINDTSTQTIA